jgi:uncharacterized membrane protein YoaK (UPF0700 family)
MQEKRLSVTAAPEVDQGAARLPAALLALTAVTGLVDAVSVLGFGVFTANMTGNVVFLGFAATGARGFSIARSLTSLVAFLAGAVIGGGISVAIDATRRRWLFAVAVCEATLLFVAALASIGLEIGSAMPPIRLYSVIVLMAIAMGFRNATVRRLAVPDLTTTVLTLTLTGLSADSSLAGGKSPRFGRRFGSVVAMFGGAVIGALLLKCGLALALLFSGVCVMAIALIYAALSPSAKSEQP